MRFILCSFVPFALFCLSAFGAPGDKKWDLVISNSIWGIAAPTLAGNGDILIGSAEGTLYSVTTAGNFRWSFETHVTTFGSPVVGPDGAIYFGSDQLHALNPDGTKRWSYGGTERDPIGYTDTPVLGPDGTIYVTRFSSDQSQQRLYAVNADGSLRWKASGIYVGAPVVAGDGSILISTGLGGLVCFNPDGILRWEVAVGSFIFSPPALSTNGTIVIGSTGASALQAFSSNGASLWGYGSTETGIGSPVIRPDGTVYYGLASGRIVALSSVGELRWEFPTPGTPPSGSIASTAALASDGTLYLGTDQGLLSLDSNGTLRWRFEANAVGSPLIGPDGTVYVAVNGDRLVAIEGTGAPLADGQWPMFGRDAAHRASAAIAIPSPSTPSNVVATVDSFTDKISLRWSSVRGATHYEVLRSSTPNELGAVVIASDVTGDVTYDDRRSTAGETYYYFVRARNSAGRSIASGPAQGRRRAAQVGEAVWILPDAGPMKGHPAIGYDGTVFFATSDGRGCAVDSSGHLKWRYTFGGQVASSPMIGPDGTVYFTAGYTNNPINQQDERSAVFAMHPTGELRWMKPIPASSGTSIALAADGTLYFGMTGEFDESNPQPALIALNPDGSQKWAFHDGWDFWTTPVVGPDGTIYASSFGGKFRAVHPDGHLLWTYDSEDAYLLPPVIDERGVLYFSGAHFHSANPDGAKRWIFDNPNGGAFLACVNNEGIIFGGSLGNLRVYAFRADGSVLWSSPYAGYTDGMSLDGDGRLYVPGAARYIYCLEGSSGTKLWEFTATSDITGGPVLGTNNTLYAGSSDGTLYAIRTSAGAMNSPWPQTLHDSRRTARATQTPLVPPVPTNLIATVRTRVTDVRLTWTSAVGATAYEVFRSTNNALSNAISLGEVTGQLFFDDQSAVSESPYTYWVQAKNSGGTSPFSEPAAGIRRQAVPGDALFTWNVDGPVNGSPAIGSDGTIYVSVQAAVSNGQLFGEKVVALRPDGTVRWQYDNVPSAAPPTLAPDGTIYVPSASRLLALNPDGTKRWDYFGDEAIDSAAALGKDGTIYVGTRDGNLCAITPDGTLRWKYALGSGISASPAVGGDDVIYVFSQDGILHAVQPDATQRWNVRVGTGPIGDGPMPSPAIAEDGTIYVSSRSLTAVNMDGTIRWQGPTIPLVAPPVIDSRGNIIVGSGSGEVFSVHPAGTNSWQFASGGFHFGAAAASANGFAYLATSSGRLLALTQSGSNAWEFNLGAESRSSPAIAPDGTVYVGTEDHKVRSFFGSGPLANSAWPMIQRDLLHSGRASSAPPAPGAAHIVVASDGSFNDRVRISWPSITGAWFYEVWRMSVTNLTDAAILAPSLTGTNTFDDRSAVEGIEYFYFVRAGNSAGLGEFSPTDLGYRRIAVPGEVVGEFDSRSGFSSAVAMSTNSLMYVGGYNGRFHALNPDLTESWLFSTGLNGGFTTPAIADDGSVIFGGADGVFRVFNPDGSIRWETNGLAVYPGSNPSVGPDGTIYFCTNLRKLYAFNPDGTQAWELGTTGTYTTGTALGVDGTIYFGTDDRMLNAVSRDGHWLWSVAVGGALLSEPAVGPDGVIYFGCDDRRLYAVNPEGTRKWNLQVGGVVRASPVIGPDCTIYVGSADRNLYAVNPDGTKQWQFQSDGGINSAATVASDGTIFFGTQAESLYAIRPDGTLLWRTAGVGSMAAGSLLLPDGRLVFGTVSGPLRAVRTAQHPARLHWPTFRHDPVRSGFLPAHIEFPITNQSFSLHSGESFAITPEWNLPDRTIVLAELFLGTNRFAISTNSPFTLAAIGLTPGTNTLFVRLMDSTGCFYRSSSFSVQVFPLTLKISNDERDEWRLSFITLFGHRYTLQSTTNLTDWNAIDSQSFLQGEELTWRVNSTSTPSGFRAFRVRVSD